MSDPHNKPSEGDTPQPSKLRQLAKAPLRLLDWMSESRANMLVVAGTTLLASIVLVGMLIYKQHEFNAWLATRPKPVSLKYVVEEFDSGDYTKARNGAKRVLPRLRRSQDKALCLYVLGVTMMHQAEDTFGEQRSRQFELAASYLQESGELGFPEGREGDALWQFGKALALAGKYVESRPILEQALEQGLTNQAEIHHLLAGAYRRGPSPNLEKSLEHLTAYVNDKSLDSNDRYAAQLLRAQILWDGGDAPGCQQALEGIPVRATVSSEATLLRGRILLHNARQTTLTMPGHATAEQKEDVKKKYAAAVEMLRRAQEDPIGTRAIRKAMYLIGIAYLDQRDLPAALTQFERTRKVFLDTPEGQAAALQEADVLRKLGRDDEAVDAYRRVLSSRKTTERFDNLWIPLDKFRARALEAYRGYLAKSDYVRAGLIAERLAPLYPKARALELVGEAYRDEARQLLTHAAEKTGPEAIALAKQGRARMRDAGEVFRRQAKLNFTTKEYPQNIWRAADCFWIGQQYTQAAAAYEEFLKYELRRQRATALVRLGDCQMSLGRIDEAIGAVRECIELFPDDAAAYEARFIASRAYREKGDTATAEQLLRDNLSGDLLTPESREWRNSLFELGDLLISTDRHQDSVEKLEEAVERYPTGAQAVAAHYALGQAYRKLAQDPQKKLATATVSTAKAALRKQMNASLEAAVTHFGKVQELLTKQQDQHELLPLDQTMLRNSYFAQGGALFDLQRYEDAIKAYSTATNRYQHEPEVLEAFVQIANCYRRLDRLTEARGTMQQAKVVLQRLSTKADFAMATNLDRQQWTELLDWWSTVYQTN